MLTHDVKKPKGFENLGISNRFQAQEFGRFVQSLTFFLLHEDRTDLQPIATLNGLGHALLRSASIQASTLPAGTQLRLTKIQALPTVSSSNTVEIQFADKNSFESGLRVGMLSKPHELTTLAAPRSNEKK